MTTKIPSRVDGKSSRNFARVGYFVSWRKREILAGGITKSVTSN